MPIIKKLSSLASIKRKTPTDRLPTGYLNDNSVTSDMIRDLAVKYRHLDLGSTINSTGTIEAFQGNSFLDARTGSRTININNLRDGQSLSILVLGASTNVITINAYSDTGITSLPVKYGAGQNGQMASAYSIFTVFRIGQTLTDPGIVIIGPIHGIA
jgi:hypothetical protein